MFLTLCVSEVKSTVVIIPGLVSGVESGVLGSEWQRSGCPGSQVVGSVMEAKSGRLLTKSSLRLNWFYWFVYIHGVSLLGKQTISHRNKASVSVVKHQSA